MVILDFWATWCAECKKLIPILGAIEKQYASRDVTVIGINERESQSVVEKFAKQNSFKAEILLDADGSVAAKYEVTGLPTLVILDTEGNAVKTIVGFYPDMQKRLEREIEPLLGH